MVVRCSESRPLIRLEAGSHEGEELEPEEIEQSSISDMECIPKGSSRSVMPPNTTDPRAKRMAAAVTAALGIMVLAGTIFLVRNTAHGPLKARLQAATSFRKSLSNDSCLEPPTFCVAPGAKQSLKDCDGDGIPDPYCQSPDGYCACVGSFNKCEYRASLCLSGTELCERPQGWCEGLGITHGGKVELGLFEYSTRDCDGDGQPDPFCQRTDSETGERSCGCLQSNNSCADTYPSSCPVLDSSPMKMLPMSDEQLAITSPVTGTLMYESAKRGDKVFAGHIIAGVIRKTKIARITAPKDGVVKDVLDIYAGDKVMEGQRLFIIEPVRAPTSPMPTTPMTTTPASSTTTTTQTATLPPTLPPLTGLPGKAVVAAGFEGFGKFGGWGGPKWRKGLYVPKGVKFASITKPDVDIDMPEDGVLTGLSPVKVGEDVNAGAQLGYYLPAVDGVKQSTGPDRLGLPPFGGGKLEQAGFKVPKMPSGGVLKSWKVNLRDNIIKGAAVAEFSGPGFKPFMADYDGPSGMVFDRQDLAPGQGLKEGADLISVGAGEFRGFKVKQGDVVVKGDPICSLNVGTDKPLDIPAGENGTVVALAPYNVGDQIGFDTPLEGSSFSLLKQPLPKLKPPNVTGGVSQVQPNGGRTRAPAGSWLKLKKFTVAVDDPVDVGDPIAEAIAVNPNGTDGPVKKIFAADSGFVNSLQEIDAGDYIAPGDEMAYISSRPEGSGVPWWLFVLLGLLCCCCLLLIFFPRGKKEEPEALAGILTSVAQVEEPMLATPPPAVMQPAPAATAAPSIFSSFTAKPPTEGIPIYFDNKPFYCKYHPIGIKFQRVAPISIEKFIFNSYGKTLGLRIGQKLTKIKDVDVTGDHHYSHVDKMLLDALAPLPWWPLRIDFKTGTGEVKTFHFTERPLGIMFTQHLPIKVEKFRPYSLAQRNGVQAGWEIMQIADEDTSVEGMRRIGITTNKAGYEHVDKHLLEGIEHLPYWKVRVDFRTTSGEIKTFGFGEKPLGIQLTKHSPFKVEKFKAHSLAEECGVQAGWTIVRIGDNAVTADHDHKHVEKELDEYFQHLPDRKK